MKPSQKQIAIVGPGRVGQAMGKLLSDAGFQLRFVAARRMTAAKRAAKFIGQGEPVALDSTELAQATVFLLTTSDAALASVAAQLAGRPFHWRAKVALHTSGSLASSVLSPLQKHGAAIGSLHPFQTIPNPSAGTSNLRNCFWALEGDAKALAVAKRWVNAFGGTAFRIRPENKILYHAAAFLVCPTEVTLMDRSVSLLRQCGIPEKIARPMLAQIVSETVRNFAKLGSKKALTGPAVRGDWPVIQGHLRALKRSAPEILAAYQALLRLMLRLSGREAPEEIRKLLA